MAFFDQYASRLDEAAMQHLSDGHATYTAASGPALLEVPYQLDLSHEVYDQDQVAMRVATILLPVERVPESRQGDTVAVPGRTWRVQQVLEDDGQWRRVWVS
ncbi:hypothetical protein CLM76_09380 [Vreelandella venusta]|nr:hypothetical protein CLM76_09380 [Halomonas hydrothermalis]